MLYYNWPYRSTFVRKELITIYSTFNRLDSKKQNIIINAAIEEFVKNGFEKASTNEIVKEAKISKGSLFNYFKSKKDLYLYLIEHSIQIIEELYQKVDFDETDIFKKIEKIGLQKLNIQIKHPKEFDFLAKMVHEESPEVRNIIKQKIDYIHKQGLENIYKNIDDSKFREDIDSKKAIEILNWTMFGFGEKGLKQINSFENTKEFGEQYLKDWQLYADILKKAFYK